MIVTIHYRDEDQLTFESETIEEARETAKRETAKRGWDERDCWSDVKGYVEEESEGEI